MSDKIEKCMYRITKSESLVSSCRLLKLEHSHICSSKCPLYITEEEYNNPTIDKYQCFSLDENFKCRALVVKKCEPDYCPFFKIRKDIFYADKQK